MKKRRLSIKVYLYSLLISAILFIAISVFIISYQISVKQVNTYYDNIAKENAVNVSTFIDADFIDKLRSELRTNEYQEVRKKLKNSMMRV